MNKYVRKSDSKRINWYAKIVKKNGSKRLYIRLTYYGFIIERTTGLLDTPDNRNAIEILVDKINVEIAQNTFKFAKLFPGSSEEEKRKFTELEGEDYHPEPEEITFQQAFDEWHLKAYPNLQEERAHDNLNALTSRVLPYFMNTTMDNITTNSVQTFFRLLAKPTEESLNIFRNSPYYSSRIKEGSLSRKRMLTVLGAFRKVWNYTCSNHKWTLHDPFKEMNRYISELTITSDDIPDASKMSMDELMVTLDQMKEGLKKPIKVLLMSEYEEIIKYIHPKLKPAAKLMLLTGLIPSEIAALTIDDFKEDYFVPKIAISRKRVKNRLKNPYRMRSLPITAAIRKVVEEAQSISEKKVLFTTIQGSLFNECSFRKAWYKACDRSGIERMVPYALRHTFVANCEVIGIEKYRIIDLAGHADKEMINRVYGKYRQGIESEKEMILDFYGKDFVSWNDNKIAPPN